MNIHLNQNHDDPGKTIFDFADVQPSGQ